MTDFRALTVSKDGLRFERGAANWKIKRRERWGISVGLVWGPLRRPLAPPGINPWTERSYVTIRLPWSIGPWVYVWFYRKPGARHPGRFYVGLKVLHAGVPPDDVWTRPSERDKYYVTPSISFRRGAR